MTNVLFGKRKSRRFDEENKKDLVCPLSLKCVTTCSALATHAGASSPPTMFLVVLYIVTNIPYVYSECIQLL